MENRQKIKELRADLLLKKRQHMLLLMIINETKQGNNQTFTKKDLFFLGKQAAKELKAINDAKKELKSFCDNLLFQFSQKAV